MDGVALFDLLRSSNVGIPAWDLLEGLPLSREGSDFYIIAVCDCGESGCGSDICHVDEQPERIAFHDFTYSEHNPTYHFRPENYRQTVASMKAQAKAFVASVQNSGEHNQMVLLAYLESIEKLTANEQLKEKINASRQTPEETAESLLVSWLQSHEGTSALRQLVEENYATFEALPLSAPVICCNNALRAWSIDIRVDGMDSIRLRAFAGDEQLRVLDSRSLPLPNNE